MFRFVLAPLAVVVVAAGGAWLLAGQLGGGKWTTIAVAALWLVVLSSLLGWLGRRFPDLRTPTRTAFLVTVAAVSFGFYWTSIRKTEVDETIAVASSEAPAAEREEALRAEPGPEAAAEPEDEPARERRRPAGNVRLLAGDFTGADGHGGRGKATVVKLAEGGRRLTFSDFDTDAAPDVRVYLVPGDGSSVDGHVDLGALKGARGDQQYAIPGSVDLTRHGTVVLWCRAFSVRIAVAPLS